MLTHGHCVEWLLQLGTQKLRKIDFYQLKIECEASHTHTHSIFRDNYKFNTNNF